MTTLAEPVEIEREFTVRSRSQFQHAIRRFVRNPLAMGGLVTFVLMLLAAFVGPHLFSYGYLQQSTTLSAPPGTDGHLFGTDTLGRDVLLLTMRGIQWSMLMAAVFVVVAVALGVLVGAIAGYAGGWTDDVLMRIVDVILTLPFLAVVIVLSAAFPSARSPVGIALLIALLSWMSLARIVRVEFLSLREREYVEAAHALGASSRRIVFRHLIPNSVGQITVWATLGAGGAIGAKEVASAAPDGHVLLVYHVGLVASALLQRPRPYDPVSDFTPLGLLATSPNLVTVGPKLPVKDLAALIAQGRAKKGELTYGSSGFGGSGPPGDAEASGTDGRVVHARTVPGLGACHPGRHRGRRAGRTGLGRLGRASSPGRPAATARRDGPAPHVDPAGRADHRRGGVSRFRPVDLVRDLGSPRDARGTRRDARRRSAGGPRAAGRPGSLRQGRPRRRTPRPC